MNKIDTGMKNKFFMIVVYVVLWCVAILAAYTIICNSLAVSPSEDSLRSQHYFRLLVREAIELPFYCAVMFFLYKLAGGYKRYGGFAGLLRLRGGSQVANLKTMLVTLWSCGLVSLLLYFASRTDCAARWENHAMDTLAGDYGMATVVACVQKLDCIFESCLSLFPFMPLYWRTTVVMLVLLFAISIVSWRYGVLCDAVLEGDRIECFFTVKQPRIEKIADGESADRSLLAAKPADRGVSAPELASEKNQEMDRLLGRRTIPADYAATMRALHGDSKQDDLTRNFAVQHLGLHVQELLRRGTYDPGTPEAAQVRATLESASRETASSVAGPAFLALADLAAVDPHVDAAALDARLAACAGDASAHVPTRVIAVQLCGTRRVRAAIPALDAILADSSAGTVLRLSARRAREEVTNPRPFLRATWEGREIAQ